jgi:putative glycosyltransferase
VAAVRGAASPWPELSVVTTLYYSAPYLREFYARTLAQIERLGVSYEFVIVNDGSPDDSLEVALALQERDPGIVVVDLSRNFGHHQAILQGLAQTRGQRVFLIDCDLEESPEVLQEFNRVFAEAPCDVAFGVQAKRKGGLQERLFGWLFYKLINYLSDTDVPENATIARLMSRRYVDALLGFREQSLFLGGVMAAVGFRQIPVEVQKSHKGTTTYTFRRKLSALTSAVTSFSEKPLRLVFYSGVGISLVSFAFAAWFAIEKLLFQIPVSGFTTLAVSLWLIGGLIILFLGIIGIYIAKIFMQTKSRPLAIVKHVYEADASALPAQATTSIDR